MNRRFARRQGWKTFRWPGVFACLTAAGLIGSLVDDGWWDRLGALALFSPMLVVAARLSGSRYR